MTERLTDEALLPCPFCGGEAMNYSKSQFWIGCKECGSELPIMRDKDEANAAWNRRATPADDLRAENERLREAIADLVSWFDSGPSPYGPWIILAGEQGADEAVEAAFAALSQNGGAA